MCGIVGSFAFKKEGEKYLHKIEEANDYIRRRGPDGKGIFQKEHIALAHRRLSIIDVSCSGNQPMTTADRRFTIVFNGEIFNYQELKQHYLTEEERISLRSTS